MDLKEIENDYLKQYPKEESPLTWSAVVSLDEIYNFMLNRKGRKIGLKTEKDVLDGGQLIYFD
jgi:hypothetical protein